MVVSKRAFDLVVQALEHERAERQKQTEYNRVLVQTIVDMRRQRDGSFAQAPVKIDPDELSDPLDDAIADRAKGNGALRRHLLATKAALRAAGADEDAIRDAVIHWRDPEADD